MSVIKKTLQENYIFFIRELARIDEELKGLPVGSVSLKKIGKATYYYRQWREGRKVKSVSLGANAPADLLEGINKRRSLEKQRKEILIKEDYTFLIPSPWIFAYHKILVSGRRKVKDKKDKDIFQAIALLREISKRPDMAKKAAVYLEKLPTPWAKRIKKEISNYLPDYLRTV